MCSRGPLAVLAAALLLLLAACGDGAQPASEGDATGTAGDASAPTASPAPMSRPDARPTPAPTADASIPRTANPVPTPTPDSTPTPVQTVGPAPVVTGTATYRERIALPKRRHPYRLPMGRIHGRRALRADRIPGIPQPRQPAVRVSTRLRSGRHSPRRLLQRGRPDSRRGVGPAFLDGHGTPRPDRRQSHPGQTS